MEFKIIVYLLIGIGYFVYKQYQKLQGDALSRKQDLEKNKPRQDNTPTVFEIKPRPQQKVRQMPARKPTERTRRPDLEFDSASHALNMKHGNLPSVKSEPENLAETQNANTNSTTNNNDFNLQQLFVWTEILGKPISLR